MATISEEGLGPSAYQDTAAYGSVPAFAGTTRVVYERHPFSVTPALVAGIPSFSKKAGQSPGHDDGKDSADSGPLTVPSKLRPQAAGLV